MVWLKSQAWRYALALVAVATATVLRLGLSEVWGPTHIPFVFYFGAVALVGWVAGFRPALASVGLGAVAMEWWFMPPHGRFPPWDLLNLSALISFIGVGFIIAGSIEAARRAQLRAAQADERWRRRATELQSLLDAVPTLVWIAHDPECRVVTGNRALYSRLGLPVGANLSLAHRGDASPLFEVWIQGRRVPLGEQPLERAAAGEDAQDLELEIRAPGRPPLHLLGNAAALRDDLGRVRGAVAAFVDISPSKQAEAALAESDDRFARAFRASPDALVISRASDGVIREVNESYLQFHGLRYAEVIGRRTTELGLLSPADGARVLELYQRDGRVRECELTIRTCQGYVRSVLLSVEPIEIRGEACLLSTQRDITDRKLLEEQRRQLSDIIEATPDFVAVAQPDGRLIYVNEAGRRLLGLPSKSALQDYDHRQIYPDWVYQRARDAWLPRALRDGSAAGDAALRTVDGREVPVTFVMLVHRDAAGAVRSISTIARDISERKSAEEALQESERQFRELAESMPQLVWTAGSDGQVDYYNSRIGHYAGAVRDEAGRWRWQQLLHPAEAERTREAWREAVRLNQPYVCEHRLQMRDGSYRWHLSRGFPVERADGTVRWFGTATDIDPQKQALEALRESEERLQLTLFGTGMGVWSWDLVTGAVSLSPEMVRLFEQEGATVGADAFAALIDPDQPHRALERLHVAIDEHALFEAERELPDLAPAQRWVSVRGRAFYDAAGHPRRVLGVVIDITERKKIEQQLEAARDEAVRASRAKDEFLAMLSHELRTPLNPVLLLASEAARDPTLSPKLREDFSLIAQHVALEARLIDDLLDLHGLVRGKIGLQCVPLDLHRLVRDSLPVIREEVVAKGLTLAEDFGATNPQVIGDPVRLRQVIWNVLRNAVKFTPPGGRILLSTAQCHAEFIALEITDTGIGMTPEEARQAFEPFAQSPRGYGATGPRSGSLGLGLAIARQLVEGHAGRIAAHSAGLNQGTTIRITLPTTTQAPDADPPAVPAPKPTRVSGGGGWRILLVDDHAATRVTLARLLERRGHRPVSAASVAEAVAKAAVEPVDVLVSDVGLPDGTGYDVMQQVRELRPQVVGIAVSGYGQENDLAQSRAAGFARHLTKPITAAALEQALDELRAAMTREGRG